MLVYQRVSITLDIFFHMFRQQICHPFGPALAIPSHSGAEGTEGTSAAEAPFASEATIGKGVKGWWIIIYPIGSMYAIYGNMDLINIPQLC